MSDNLRYFAVFSDTGKRITSFVADGMPLNVVDIIKSHPTAIEITAEEQALYMQGYIRGVDGKPCISTATDTCENARLAKIEQIKDLAKAKLVETDHNIVEYFELKNITDEQYEILKKQRQNIRDYRDNLISAVIGLNDAHAINAIEFKM